MRCPICGGCAYMTGHYVTGGKHGSDVYECDECGYEWEEECDGDDEESYVEDDDDEEEEEDED